MTSETQTLQSGDVATIRATDLIEKKFELGQTVRIPDGHVGRVADARLLPSGATRFVNGAWKHFDRVVEYMVEYELSDRIVRDYWLDDMLSAAPEIKE